MLLVIKYTILFLLQYFARVEVRRMISYSHPHISKSGFSTGLYKAIQSTTGGPRFDDAGRNVIFLSGGIFHGTFRGGIRLMFGISGNSSHR